MYQYSPLALGIGPFFSKILLSFWKQLYFKMTGIRKHKRALMEEPQNLFWFVPILCPRLGAK